MMQASTRLGLVGRSVNARLLPV